MNKQVLLIRGAASSSQSAFKQWILDEVVPSVLEASPEKLKVGITGPAVPALSLIPIKRSSLAMISIRGVDRIRCDSFVASLPNTSQSLCLTVTESTPLSYEKTWDDHIQTPGVVLLTLLRRNQNLSYEDFLHEWHDNHSPMALEIHPLWNYIRNVVEDENPVFDGIVEEHYRHPSDVFNPLKMFGANGSFRSVPNMIKVYRHVSKFLDLQVTENYLLNEVHIVS